LYFITPQKSGQKMDRAEVDLTALPGGKAMDSCSEPRIGVIRCRLPWSNAAAGRRFHIPFSHAASAAILAAFLTMILPALLATLRATLLARFGTHVGGLLWRTHFGPPTLLETIIESRAAGTPVTGMWLTADAVSEVFGGRPWLRANG